MTYTEKILSLLELNENIPSLVISEDIKIVSSNNAWNIEFKNINEGDSFYNLFDVNTLLLVKNNLLDAKTFSKIQRREVSLQIFESEQKYKLIISPFRIKNKYFYYIILFKNDISNDLLAYPTLDDNSTSIKYAGIIKHLFESTPKTLVEKNNLQFDIDIEKEPIAIKDKEKYLFTNESFNKNREVSSNSVQDGLITDENYLLKLLQKIEIAEDRLFNVKSILIIESTDYKLSSINHDDRLMLYPLFKLNGEVNNIISIGKITLKVKKETRKDEPEIASIKNELIKDSSVNIELSEKAQIIYNRNNYDILEANNSASELYGYEIDSLVNMNVTSLFPPEEMQKLLTPSANNDNFIFKQIKNDGSEFEVNAERNDIVWNGEEACLYTVSLNLMEEEVFELEKDGSVNIEKNNSEPKQTDIPQKETVDKKSVFLSSLFHELLTPVNVILGFVQEIIDSIEKPSEEQEESAQIIKDNQQVLLQAMNTAVQYVQIEENGINLNVEKIDLNNCMVDLHDSVSRISSKENIEIIFNKLDNSIFINSDRKKLIAAMSYFIKFCAQLTEQPEIIVSFKTINNKLHLLVKDSETEITDKTSASILEIYSHELLNNKMSYSISPITLRLAKKLNEILAVEVKEYTDENELNYLAFVLEASAEQFSNQSSEVKEIEKREPIHKSDEEAEEKISLVENEVENLEELITEETEDIEIAVSEIEEQIIEDIEEETEIVSEDIITPSNENDELPNLSKVSCLFIDDTVDTQLLFKSQMKEMKDLQVCSNLTEALPFLRSKSFDLIIVDINLNDTYNGFDALKIIRQFDSYKSTPIFAVTAYPFEGDKEKFINFGFSNYFIKPLLKEQILDSLALIKP